MENRLLDIQNPYPVTKRRRTHGDVWQAASTGEERNRVLKRKTPSKLTPQTVLESFPFKRGNYRGALQEYLQKRGYGSLSFDIKQKEESDHNSPRIFICTCTTGDIKGTGEARGKKLARQLSALAVLKKMKLVPAGYEHPEPESQDTLKPRVVEKKSKEELFAERELDEENVYSGIVLDYRPDREYGFIAIDEEISFKGVTAEKCVYARKDDIVCYSDAIGMYTDSKVVFKVYKNSMGLGAYEITNEDGSPILFDPKVEEEIQCDKKLRSMKPMIENDQYLNGNFRGALQEYLSKKSKGVTVEYKTEFLLPDDKPPYHIARCKAIGEKAESFVGYGHASLKKNAIQFASLDYMLKLNIITIAQHNKVHNSKKDGAIGGGHVWP